MVRAAMWLVNDVGVGNVFTKEQLRQEFPGVSQIDRRIRDLRDYGWVIRSNTDDVTLRPEEQRLVTIGLAVWDPEERRKGGSALLSAKDRRAVFERDGFQCVICGIGGGEAYPDREYETAVLLAVVLTDDRGDESLVTQCRRCKAGNGPKPEVNVRALVADIRALSAEDRMRLMRWATRGRRGPTPLDRTWTALRQLSRDTRDRVVAEVGDLK